MSSDNILIILHNRGKVRVYDVNFSQISSFPEWDFPMTRENSEVIKNHIVNSKYELEIHKCETESQAEGFCARYEREQIVEYGFSSIIAKPLAAEIQKAHIKKKKVKVK